MAKHILLKISRSRHNQTIQFGLLINYSKFLFSYHIENVVGTLVPDLFLFFEKDLDKVKASGQHLSFNIF